MNNAAQPPHRGPGRPLDPTRRQAILKAARALVREIGYQATTIEAIAQRAGVGKATIYRRWSSKALILLEAFQPEPEPESAEQEAPEGLHEALARIVEREQSHYRTESSLDVFFGLMAAFASQGDDQDTFRASYFTPNREAYLNLLAGARVHGELAGDVEPDLLVDAIMGAVFVRSAVQGKAADEAYREGLTRLLTRGAGEPQASAR